MATYAAYRHVELDNVGYGKKRVLKPPGGGSSDIFGSTGEVDSPRRVKQSFNQSTLGSNFFSNADKTTGSSATTTPSTPQSNGSSAPETPRSNKPGNDSYKRLFGPPDAPPPSTPNSKNHMRSNITLSSSSASSTEPSSPAKCNGDKIITNGQNNGHITNGNGYHHNDVIAFRRIKRFRGSSCMPRNPVTGDGVDVKPHASRRIVRRSRDGNPVTGAGYESAQQNGNISGAASSAGSEKSSTDSSPSVGAGPTRLKNRVPPGGFSSGLW